MESTMEERHKECLLKNRSFLCSKMSLSAVLLAKLTESSVLTDEHLQKLQNIIRNETMNAAVLHFLAEFIPKRGPETFNLFLEALRGSQQKHISEHLEKWLRNDCSEEQDIFRSLRSELQSHYKRRLASIRPMPWLQEIHLNLTEIYVKRQLKLKTNHKGDERIVTMDDLFTPQETKEIPRRLLIEGNPGIGKSMICQSLAHEWGTQSCGSQCGTLCVHSYDLVLHFHASDFKHLQSVAEAITTHLLPFDCNIPSRQLEELLRAKNVLLIVDAFDEASSENEILHQLIEGKLLKHKTLLITSRPYFLQNKLRHFESRFTVEGYDKEEQFEHVKRYADSKKIDPTQFTSIPKEEGVRDLCDNPLNLTLLCILREEDNQLMYTRTALYTSIHNIIKRKASERMNLTEAEVEELLLRPLYQMAFETHRKNETVICQCDFRNIDHFEQVCQVGYLNKEFTISRLQGITRFSFCHKSFMEFLTAKHIALMDPLKRLVWLHGIRYANYAIWVEGLAIEEDFDVRQNDPVLGFLFGLMEQNREELAQMASVIMKETHFSKPQPISSSFCDASHQLIRLIGELTSCMKGILKLGNLRLQPPIPLNVDLRDSHDAEKISFVKKLMKCKNIKCSKICIDPRNDTRLQNIVSELRIGQANSFQQVNIDCGYIKRNPCEGFSFGHHLSGLELLWFKPSHSYLLEAALDKPLTSLHFIECYTLDDRCISLLHRLLRNQHLQSVQLTSLSPWKPHFGRLFFADFTQLENLQSLEISLIDLTDEEMRILKAILQSNKLIKLGINSCDYPRSLESVLNDSFPSMLSLRELQLLRVNIIHLPNLRHLNLVNISLRPSTLNDNQIALLSDVLRSLRNLQELHIDFYSDVSVAECSLRELFEAIAGCHRLQILRFEYLEMGDSVVPSVCRMIESLEQLRKFTSIMQRGESLTEEGFKQLEPIFKRKGLHTWVM
ncbi:hypothetical protein CAPTEDRAFT_216908 [Capitella teleta]|uniref:NACHT domain-containing protein n=1 Tax=Capitella teleta TaxID=283909 RepID=R7VIE5_CAPTE|nr:hypothetical protein CAPTEDRAFT_216908 [Capitella teleta]|eukprot:ELU18613.1 hypothetical protein CAPTEDRAFT_216908 [Capitella teleta]